MWTVEQPLSDAIFSGSVVVSTASGKLSSVIGVGLFDDEEHTVFQHGKVREHGIARLNNMLPLTAVRRGISTVQPPG